MANKSRERDDRSIQYKGIPQNISRCNSVEISPATTRRDDSTGERNSKNSVKSSAKFVTTPEFIRATVEFWKAVSLPLRPSNSDARSRSSETFQRGLGVGCHFSSSTKSDFEHLIDVKGRKPSQPPACSLRRFLENHYDEEKVTFGGHTLTIHDTEAEDRLSANEDLPLSDLREKDDVENCGNFSRCGSPVNGDLEIIVQSSSSASHSNTEISSSSDSSLSSDTKEGQLLPENSIPLPFKPPQEKDKTVFQNPNSESNFTIIVPVSMWNKVEENLSKGKHALAGGLAGIFVSVCLHPVDTVKSIVQVRSTNQESLFHTIKRITSERGVMGLYRGIPSNLASSAPISAVYTFTYESAKGAFLPLLPKEYHSLAHCGAGGCASVATSFIFTPSERVKQQMQVHSCYQNSWNALMGIIQRGGLPSLYAGWRAVLWRNVPHSIIKFYTYERLKQLMHPSLNPGSHFSAFPTLVCGGIAGSTAALFTTPFDVVKTRLQAQMPGSIGNHGAVLPLLKEISKTEGIRGLYRGLTPRLLMYVSQGAIFFGSYEFLKSIFSFNRAGGETCHVGTVSDQSSPHGVSALA